MIMKIKTFEELNTLELYEILKARAEIFVVEQSCVYQDLDDIDKRSLHVFLEEENLVKAYLRIFDKEGETGTVHMGRVLTIDHGMGLGGYILKEGIRASRERMKADEIYIEAQCYARGFYEREGFQVTSGEFLEDGIPHVEMRLHLT